MNCNYSVSTHTFNDLREEIRVMSFSLLMQKYKKGKMRAVQQHEYFRAQIRVIGKSRSNAGLLCSILFQYND